MSYPWLKQRSTNLTAFAALVGMSGASLASAEVKPVTLVLKRDVVSLAEVAGSDGQSRLAAIVADASKPHPKRQLLWLKKQGANLIVAGEQGLSSDDGAFDICRLHGPKAPAELLTLRPDGVYRLGTKAPLAATDNIFAQPSDDSVPRVHLCFQLFAGEAPALVVPSLGHLQIFRSKDDGATYQPYVRLPQTANANYNWTSTALRGEQLETTQLVSVRLDFPAVTALDFDGDGRIDLCLSRGESLQCYLQGPGGFTESQQKSFFFPVRSDAERQQQSVRTIGQLVELERGALPAYLVSKTEWNVSDMRTAVYIFRQAKAGGFSGKPAQIISRKGYFAYQEYLDLDEAGRKDLVAPVAALGWSDLMSIYLAKAADIDFVRYKNQGGTFATQPDDLHSLSFPVDFKRLTSVLGSLPLWQIRLPNKEADVSGHDVAFFPAKEAIDLVRLQKRDGALVGVPLGHIPVTVGSEVIASDLDGNGINEIIFTWPREPGLQNKVVMVDLSGL